MADFTQAWDWPQWTMVAFMVFGLIFVATNHGEIVRRSFPHYLISVGLNLFVLICGGFFQ